MLLTGSTTIRDVVLFPTLRPEQVTGVAAEDDEQSPPPSAE